MMISSDKQNTGKHKFPLPLLQVLSCLLITVSILFAAVKISTPPPVEKVPPVSVPPALLAQSERPEPLPPIEVYEIVEERVNLSLSGITVKEEAQIEGKETEETTEEAIEETEAIEGTEEIEETAETALSVETDVNVVEEEPAAEPSTTREVASEAYYIYPSTVVPLSVERQVYASRIAEEYGLPVELLYAIMQHESHYLDDVISRTNDYGIMQINKSNHDWLKKRLGIKDVIGYEGNVRSGAYILSLCAAEYPEIHQMLMCYNRGIDKAEKLFEEGTVADKYSCSIVEKMEQIQNGKEDRKDFAP